MPPSLRPIKLIIRIMLGPRHHLRDRENIGEFLVIHPLAPLDHNAARPDEAIAKAAHGDF